MRDLGNGDNEDTFETLGWLAWRITQKLIPSDKPERGATELVRSPRQSWGRTPLRALHASSNRRREVRHGRSRC